MKETSNKMDVWFDKEVFPQDYYWNLAEYFDKWFADDTLKKILIKTHNINNKTH